LVTIRFDLTSFPDKIYQWREALERRNTACGAVSTVRSPTTFDELERIMSRRRGISPSSLAAMPRLVLTKHLNVPAFRVIEEGS
jgi:hypothetical protein